MTSKYDAIMIGAGHNVLVTAAYLARAGRKVLVLERCELVGGCVVTGELWPGFNVSTASYVICPLSSSGDRKVIAPAPAQDLDLL